MVSPGNEPAWTVIAQMSRGGLLNKKQHSRQIGKILDSLFYTFRNVPDFLPKVPQMRGDSPSKYCVEMFELAIERFKTAEQPQVVSKLEDQLGKVKQGKGKRE